MIYLKESIEMLLLYDNDYRSIIALLAFCDGCDVPTSVDHAFNCRK